MEQWKIIEEYPNYEVSNIGNVRSIDCLKRCWKGTCIKKGRLLKQTENSKGYYRVNLAKNGKNARALVHRLVATAFIENVENKACVNHIDNNPKNNVVDNLEWCTHKENMDWMKAQGRNKRTEEWLKHLHKSQAKTYIPVIAINEETGEKIYFPNLNDVKKHGFQPSCVCDCCKGKRGRKHHKGYKWKYAS